MGEGETVRAANGTTMRICGALRTTLDFGTFRATLKFTLLEDLFYYVVRGVNFDEFVSSIRPGDLRMEMRVRSLLSFRRSGITKKHVSALVSKETVTLLPYSKSTLPCSIVRATPTSQLLAFPILHLFLKEMES